MRTICSSFVWEEFKTFSEKKKCYDATSKIVINNKKLQAWRKYY